MVANAPSAKSVTDALTLAILVAGLVLGVAFVPRILGTTFTVAQGPLVGKSAPAFSLPLVANAKAGQTKLALADLKGEAVILDFWATWCGPCRAEAPIVNAVAGRFRGQGLAVVGVNTSDRDGLAGPWALAHHLDYPIVYDTGSETAADYGVTGMPTLIVISRKGDVMAVREGMTDADELEALVKKAL